MKNRTRIIFVVMSIIFGSCTPKIIKHINYDSNYNNKENVENEILSQGIKLTLSDDEPKGKGLLSIRDSQNRNKKETTFTIVRKEYLTNGDEIFVNEVPTTEGMFELKLIIIGGNHESKFTIIEDWKNKIEFATKSSSVKMNKPSDVNGLICVKVEYEGKQINKNRRIKLSNEFYIESD